MGFVIVWKFNITINVGVGIGSGFMPDGDGAHGGSGRSRIIYPSNLNLTTIVVSMKCS